MCKEEKQIVEMNDKEQQIMNTLCDNLGEICEAVRDGRYDTGRIVEYDKDILRRVVIKGIIALFDDEREANNYLGSLNALEEAIEKICDPKTIAKIRWEKEQK